MVADTDEFTLANDKTNITVSYHGKTVSFVVKVEEKYLKAVDFMSTTKTHYFVGEKFDPSGTIAILNYSGHNNIKTGKI